MHTQNALALGASASVFAIIVAIATYAPNYNMDFPFIGNVKLKLPFNNYICCMPNKNSLLSNFQDLYEGFLEGEPRELQPYYINGHYAEK